MAQRLANIGDGGTLIIADGVTVLPFPPVAFGLVPDGWDGGGPGGVGVVPTLDIVIMAAAAVSATAAYVVRGTQYAIPGGLADAALTDADVNVATNVFHKVAHGYLTGDGPFPVTFDAGDALTGLVDGVESWVIVTDADHFKVASSVANAVTGVAVDVDYATRAVLDLGTLAAHNLDIAIEAILPGVAGNAITFDIVFDAPAGPTLSEVGSAVTLHVKDNVTTNGLLAAVINTSTKVRVKTGTATPNYVLQAATDNFVATALAVVTGTQGFTFDATDAERFYWSGVEDVPDFDLDAQLARTVPVEHRPNATAYAVVATLSVPVALTVLAQPVVDQGG